MILSNGSPVFAAMWSSSTHEGLAQTVRLEAEPALVLLLLRYIYGLQLSVSLQQLPGLWMLADMYQVSGWVGAGRAAVTAPGGCWLLRCCVAAAPHPAASVHCINASAADALHESLESTPCNQQHLTPPFDAHNPQVHGLACAITDWLTKQHLGPDALAAVIPAARRVSSAQQQQLEQWLLPQAANNISEVCDTDQFKSTWCEDDERMLLAASSETRTG